MMWKFLLIALGATLGCIQPDLVTCEDGLACPAGDRCDEVHHGCVAPEQLTACTGVVDGTDCTAGSVSGGCFDGVCLARGCGNRVIEAGEACDDGNQLSGGGCSGDCRSTERCGNGVVDPGEDCDDGNLVSRDGCDSRCRLETAAWQVTPIAPNLVDARKTAYDPGRHRLVHVSYDGSTWEWDGARWTVTMAVAGVSVQPLAVYYDPDRQQIAMVGSDITGAIHAYARGGGGAWTAIDTGTGGPAYFDGDESIDGMIAAYDPSSHRLFAVATYAHLFPFISILDVPASTTRAWSMDATGAWTQIASLPEKLYDAVAAFDPVAAQLLVEDDGGTEWIYDGTGWTSSVSGFGPQVSLAIDPGRGRLVLVDGQSQAMYERLDGAWSAVADSAVPCGTATEYRPLYYNAASGSLELFSVDSSAICTWSAGWTERVPALPSQAVGATYDPASRRMVVLSDARSRDPAAGVEPWQLAPDGWLRIDTPHEIPGRAGALSVYASGRAATIVYGGVIGSWTPETWGFDGADWAQTAPPLADSDPTSVYAMAYDSTHGRVLLMISSAWWSLGDGDTAWQAADIPATDDAASALAWDARNATLVAVDQLTTGGSPLVELTAQGWTGLDLVPGDIAQTTSTALLSESRSGGVLAVSPSTGATWERVGPAWHRLPAVPLRAADRVWTAYNPADGSVLYIANTQTGRFAAMLTRSSPTALESCRPGEDLDGDGLAGCDDPDCFWACALPPPYARP